MPNSVSIAISNHPITGKERKLVHHQLVIGGNLEMYHTFFSRQFEEGGLSTLEYIETHPTYTDEQKEAYRVIAQDFSKPTSTVGYMVDSVTGDTVQPDPETGLYPEGSVTELTYWQALTVDDVAAYLSSKSIDVSNKGQILISDLVYGLMELNMLNTVTKNRI